jgi:hypothetical protein
MCIANHRLLAWVIMAAAVGSVICGGCSASNHEAAKTAAKASNHSVGPPLQHTSSETAPDRSKLPIGAVVEPADEPHGELTRQDDQEWVKAKGEAWVRLSDEPGKHMEAAREAFEHQDPQTAAAELDRAASQMRLEAYWATPRVTEGLRGSARELDQLAQELRQGEIEFISDMDERMARAARVLADHCAERAEVALKQQRPHDAGHLLKSAGNYLQKLKWSAEYLRDAQLRQTMENLGRDILAVSGKLIEGVGYTTDEAGTTIAGVGEAVEKFGKNVAAAENVEKPHRRSNR